MSGNSEYHIKNAENIFREPLKLDKLKIQDIEVIAFSQGLKYYFLNRI